MIIPTVSKFGRSGTLARGAKIYGILSVCTLISSSLKCLYMYGSDHEHVLNVNDEDEYWMSAIALMGIAVVFASIFLYGVIEKKHNFMLPWLILDAIYKVIGVVAFIVLLVLSFVYNFYADIEGGFIALIIFGGIIIVLSACLSTYLWVVSVSHYLELKEENKSGTDISYRNI